VDRAGGPGKGVIKLSICYCSIRVTYWTADDKGNIALVLT